LRFQEENAFLSVKTTALTKFLAFENLYTKYINLFFRVLTFYLCFSLTPQFELSVGSLLLNRLTSSINY